ncbi:MAG: DUF4124 domain-containing protein [Pseudoxanthomonas sp.]
MRVLALLFMILVAPAVTAQQVYKCVGDKQVSYQSAPCGPTQVVARQWDAAPGLAPSTDEPRQRQLKSQRDRTGTAQLNSAARTDRVRSTSSRRNAGSQGPNLSRCDAAKGRREAKLNSVGLKRTFDLLRKLDDAVNLACK